MADSVVSQYTSSPQKTHKSTVNGDHCCLTCTELERQLEESLVELSSSQLIIKLLYKELKDITSVKMTKQPNVTQPNSTTESDTTVDVTSSKTRSRVAFKHHHSKNKASNSIINQGTQPPEDVNRYTILSNLSATDSPDENKAPTNVINMKISQDSTYNGLQKTFRRRIRHPLSTSHPRKAAHQHPLISHEAHDESTYEHEANMIPTIVNGQIIATKKDTETNGIINKLDHIHNLVKESAVEVINKKGKYAKCSKHKILLMGDSHMRGGAATLVASLDARFDVSGVVKLGSNTGSLIETAKGDVEKLTMNDFLIIVVEQMV